jgi:hypothetical protein
MVIGSVPVVPLLGHGRGIVLPFQDGLAAGPTLVLAVVLFRACLIWEQSITCPARKIIDTSNQIYFLIY